MDRSEFNNIFLISYILVLNRLNFYSFNLRYCLICLGCRKGTQISKVFKVTMNGISLL